MIRLLKLICFPVKGAEFARALRLIIIGLLLPVSVFAANSLPIEPVALDYTQNRSVWEMDPNLTGQGTLIGTICLSKTYLNGNPQKDYRFHMAHSSLYDADVLFTDGTDGSYGISGHATSIAGILLGQDQHAASPEKGLFLYQGVCPDASVNAYEYEDFVFQNLLAKRPVLEDVVLLSFGEMFEYWWARALEQAATENDFLIVASNGNGSSSNTPAPLYPAAGSNALSVGVVDEVLDARGNVDFSVPKTINSSVGPTDDRRCKPDIVAPGSAWVPSVDDTHGYEFQHNWSSLSAPIVAGTAALLQQKAQTDNALKDDYDQPGKSLVLKAVLMNSARKLPFWHKGQTGADDDHDTPLDYSQGAGVLDAMAAYQQLAAGAGKPGVVQNTGWDNRVLQGSEWGHEYTLDITEPNQIISATLCWNRVYQKHYPFNHLLEKDSDLRLELWGIDPNAPDGEVLLDYSDSVNDNIEHIYFAADPNYTAYAVRIRFNPDQKIDPSLRQRFALAWSVGPDRQVGNPWWYDLNADNAVNANDNVIYSLIDANLADNVEISPLLKTLGLSSERLQLLTDGWGIWKPYLSKLNTAE